MSDPIAAAYECLAAKYADLEQENAAMKKVVEAATLFAKNYDAYVDFGGVVPPWVDIFTEKMKKALAALAPTAKETPCNHRIIIIDRCRDCGEYIGPQ